VHTAVPVQVLGCLHDERIQAQQGEASEKRQGTKSREGMADDAAGYGELASSGTVWMVGVRWSKWQKGKRRTWERQKQARALLGGDFKEGAKVEEASGVGAG